MMEISKYRGGKNAIPREEAKETILILRAPEEEINVLGHKNSPSQLREGKTQQTQP